jgi:hypothetical protein
MYVLVFSTEFSFRLLAIYIVNKLVNLDSEFLNPIKSVISSFPQVCATIPDFLFPFKHYPLPKIGQIDMMWFVTG